MHAAMTVRISSELLDQLIAAAAASPDAEICGLLLGTAYGVTAARPAANISSDPARRFEIDPAALIAAHRESRSGGATVVGSYHSHPTGLAEPSACDAELAAADGAIWLILTGLEAKAWRAVKTGALHGRFDPVAILRY
jgi:proteasome lid subunit RPN8/RPN11